MHSIIEQLMTGNTNVVGWFKSAKAHWEEVLVDIESVTVTELAQRIGGEQRWFENHCGGRDNGQDIMVWTGFASLWSNDAGYEDGKEQQARKLLAAFQASHCSIEVKGDAEDAAKSYYLEDE